MIKESAKAKTQQEESEDVLSYSNLDCHENKDNEVQIQLTQTQDSQCPSLPCGQGSVRIQT